ncbi:hypothetical protein D3C84_1307870 [compost metagenome]
MVRMSIDCSGKTKSASAALGFVSNLPSTDLASAPMRMRYVADWPTRVAGCLPRCAVIVPLAGLQVM